MAPVRDEDIDSEDYHDYVISDGEFVGAFEQMYRNCDDPWHQDQLVPLAEDIAIRLLERADVDPELVLDLGCGKGRFTNRLASGFRTDVVATDVSVTAVETAAKRYEGVDFLASSVPPIPLAADAVDLVVASELLWYVLEDIDQLFAEMGRVLDGPGYVLLIQQFYDPEEQSYGNEVMERPADLLERQPFEVVSRVDVEPDRNHKLVALLETDE